MAPKDKTESKSTLGTSSKASPKKTCNVDWRKRGRKGKRDLLRAVRSRLSKSNEAFKRLAEDPDEGVEKMGHYPSDDFLWQSEVFMLSRYCQFLLQSILILARVFQVPTIMKILLEQA